MNYDHTIDPPTAPKPKAQGPLSFEQPQDPSSSEQPQDPSSLPTQPENLPSATATTHSQTLSETADTQPAATLQSKRLDLSSEQSQDLTKTKSLIAGIYYY